MSKGLIYFLGILTGIILSIGFLGIQKGESADTKGTEQQAKLPEGVTMLEEPVPFTEAKSFEIMQVVFEDAALASSESRMPYTGSICYSDPIVLIVADQKNTFYDKQIVKCPKDCKVMQVGTYQYQTKMSWKTVPIIRFVNQ